ncbi:DNA polymerase III subunit delta' [Clostridium sp. LY3-2]|uniref:DNA polymerase III subunit delta' n=1 Tax=Clostridium sp. LY3-2 TaxID=2942482 RepID=UPI0021525042|nr:DNA polymerase III subunit delta' [Clostridium sp. LY3-2]MCR6516244.1 DNA polymerase III subunit delta' [Clostridium sp. LY3-2]
MQNFVGHKNIINGFMRRAENNTLSHAHLISGDDGIGKSILADIFSSKIINKPLGEENADVVIYKAKKATIGVDEVRKIIEELNKKPYEGDRKVILIHNAEKLTVQAQNALLKTIEEPPNGVFIILLTTNLEIILETIKSRCQIYKLTPLNKEEMLEVLNRRTGIEENIIKSALAYAHGIPGRAERFLDDESLEKMRDLILLMLKDVSKRDVDSILKYEKEFLKFKDEKEELLSVIELFIRDIILFKELNNNDMIINSDKISEIDELNQLMSYKRLEGMIKYIKEARVGFKNNTNFSINIDIMLMGFLEV